MMPVVLMMAGFLIQNYAEWRAGGPRLPVAKQLQCLLPAAGDRTSGNALLIISVAVITLCIGSLFAGCSWAVVAVAAALVLNAVAQAIGSLIAGILQPGTIAGLVFMLPPSIWVVLTFVSQSGWTPVAAGPVLSVPFLLGTWWLAHLMGRVRNRRHPG